MPKGRDTQGASGLHRIDERNSYYEEQDRRRRTTETATQGLMPNLRDSSHTSPSGLNLKNKIPTRPTTTTNSPSATGSGKDTSDTAIVSATSRPTTVAASAVGRDTALWYPARPHRNA